MAHFTIKVEPYKSGWKVCCYNNDNPLPVDWYKQDGTSEMIWDNPNPDFPVIPTIEEAQAIAQAALLERQETQRTKVWPPDPSYHSVKLE